MQFTIHFITAGILFTSTVLALPVNPVIRSDIELAAEPVLDLRSLSDASPIDLEVTEVLPDMNLESRGQNDPYHGQYANSEAVRQQEQKYKEQGKSPNGQDGKSYAQSHNVPYYGQNGRTAAVEKGIGHPVGSNCGNGCLNSYESKISKQSQIAKAQKAGDYRKPY